MNWAELAYNVLSFAAVIAGTVAGHGLGVASQAAKVAPKASRKPRQPKAANDNGGSNAS